MADYKPVPLKLPPGIFRNGTNYENAGRWYDGNLIRFFEGVLRPIGGWLQGFANSTLTGYGRSGLAWRRNNGSRRAVVATEQKLYGWDGGTLADITPAGYTSGRADAINGFGYGTFTYGSGTYGDQRTTGSSIAATAWSLDLWGEKLVGVADHENIIYEWDCSMTTPAAALSNAPTADALFVTNERILVALGASGDPRKVAWSDRENNTVWTPTALNMAGDFTIPTAGTLMSGAKVSGGQHLILSTNDAYVMSFLGQPFIYGFNKVGSDCGVVGKLAHVAFGGRVAWMGKRNFWIYEGGSPRPIPCDVADYVFDGINRDQISKVFTVHQPRFSEIWWFYPSSDSDEPDRYVIFNYREATWSIGSLDRCGWISEGGVFEYPFGVGQDGKVYEHENGWTNNGSSRSVYATSGPVEIVGGARTMWVNQIIPDEETQGEVQLRVYTKYSPNGDLYSFGPYTISGDYVDTRLQGRQIALRIENVVDEDFRWGIPRLLVEPGSPR